MPEVTPEITPTSNPPSNVEQFENEQLTVRERAGKLIDGYQNWAERYPFAATAVETTALYMARQLVNRIGQRTGIDTGNALKDRNLDMAARHPILGALHGSVLAPLSEELVFRGALDIPVRRADKAERTGVARAMRLVTSLGFAVGHAGYVRPSKEWPKPPFVELSTKDTSVPVQQFVGSLNYSRLNQTRGFKHAVVAHAINNTLAGVVAIPEIRRRHRR